MPLRLAGVARQAGLSLRPAVGADLPFLKALFRDLRQPELAVAGWPEPLRGAFCTSQFALQHRSFVAAFPQADFLLVEQAGLPVGRLYLDRSAGVHHLIEIALLARARGKGIGGLLLDAAKSAVRRSGAEALTLQVEARNAGALRLYTRLGFHPVGRDDSHVAMRWNAKA